MPPCGSEGGRMEDEEVLKDIQERAKKYIEDFISAEFMKLAGEEVQKLMEAAGILEEKPVCRWKIS